MKQKVLERTRSDVAGEAERTRANVGAAGGHDDGDAVAVLAQATPQPTQPALWSPTTKGSGLARRPPKTSWLGRRVVVTDYGLE
jgi:hypothetical protein